MSVNAILWAAGLEKSIKPDNDISFVGPFHPSTFAFGGFVKGVKPSDTAGGKPDTKEVWRPQFAPRGQRAANHRRERPEPACALGVGPQRKSRKRRPEPYIRIVR